MSKTIIKGITENPEWIEDCNRWQGKLLTGKYAHWCYDWDFLPLDETRDGEFMCCSCFLATETVREVGFIESIRQKFEAGLFVFQRYLARKRYYARMNKYEKERQEKLKKDFFGEDY